MNFSWRSCRFDFGVSPFLKFAEKVGYLDEGSAMVGDEVGFHASPADGWNPYWFSSHECLTSSDR
jgi:hypothetical protein